MNSIFCRPSDGRWSCRFGTPGCAFDHGPLLPLAGSGTTSPLPIVIHCPDCGKQHVDEGEWATEPHKTHPLQQVQTPVSAYERAHGWGTAVKPIATARLLL